LAGFVIPWPGSGTNPGSTVEARGREILRTLHLRGSAPRRHHGGTSLPPRRGARTGLPSLPAKTCPSPRWKTIRPSSTPTSAARSRATA
jgi:hypothetical protein